MEHLETPYCPKNKCSECSKYFWQCLCEDADREHWRLERQLEFSMASFQKINASRCRELFHELTETGKWEMRDWALAIAGESGELCNLMKKILRGDFTIENKYIAIVDELADIITYCSLMLSALEMGMPIALMRKFDKINVRRGYDPEIKIAQLDGGTLLFKEISVPEDKKPLAVIITRGNLVGTIQNGNQSNSENKTVHHYGTVNTVDGLLSWEVETGNYVYAGQPPFEVGRHQYDIKKYYWSVNDPIPKVLLKAR